MKKIILSLVLCSFFGVPPIYAQDTKPAAAPAYEAPKKPEKDPVTAEEFFQAARWEDSQNHNLDAAITLLDKAVALKPDFTDAYYLRGHIKFYQQKYQEAVASFDLVIQFEPEAVNTYQYRGQAKVRLKNYQGALADFDMAISLMAGKQRVQYTAFVNRGVVKYILGNYDSAIDDFTNANKIIDSDSALFYRAMTHLKKENTGGAIADLSALADYYEKIVKTSREKYPDQFVEKKGYPENENPLAKLKNPRGKESARSKTYGSGSGSANCTGCPKTEFADFDDKLIPDNWFFPNKKTFLAPRATDEEDVIFFMLGELYEKQGDTANAIRAFTSAIIAKMYDDGRIYYRRGKLQMKNGDWEPAIRDFSWTIDGIWIPVDAYLERGIAILMLGHDALAQEDFDKFLVMYPDGKNTLAARIEAAKKEREELKKQADAK